MVTKKRSTLKQAAPKRIIQKGPTKRFPLLRFPLYNPKLHPPAIEKVLDYFDGKSLEEIAKDRNPIFAPFFLYSEHVVSEIYKLRMFPHRLNVSLLKKLFNRIVPLNPSNLEKTLFTTRMNCIVALEILNRKYPPWGTKHRLHLRRQYAVWREEIKGKNGEPISQNSFEQIYYDAIKEYEWFKPLLWGPTQEEKFDDFLKMLKEFVDYHWSKDAPLKHRPSYGSYAVEIFRDAVKGKKAVLK